jgi:hypothetical protein
MARKPVISSARILALVAIAAFVAVVVLESRGDAANESPASSDRIVRASNPVGEATTTPSIPKLSWPAPNANAPMGVGASKAGTEPSGLPAVAEPCRLVSESEAASILEENVSVSEGLQGPSCIYASSDSAQQVAVVVENGPLSDLRHRPDRASRVEVDGRTGWCLRHGSSSVQVPLGDGRVLDVSGPCAAATRFAALALDRVES